MKVHPVISVFHDRRGKLSSKRILGAVVLVFAMGLHLYIVITEKTGSADGLIWPYSVGAGLLGIGTFEPVQPSSGPETAGIQT